MSQSPNGSQEISNKYFENQPMEFPSPVDPSKPPKSQLEINLIQIDEEGKKIFDRSPEPPNNSPEKIYG